MTERHMGATFKWFIAKVVNRGDGKEGEKDKTESGRVQIRIFGKHDDEKNIPDDKLPWAVPLQPIGGMSGTGPSQKGIGSTPVGLKKGTIVVGFYADADENIPILFGVMHRSGADGGQDGTNITPDNNDLPQGARKEANGKDQNDVTKKSVTEEIAKEDQLHATKKTIGDLPFDGSGALDAINKADPSNLSGAIPGALSGLKSMTNTLGVAGSLLSNFQSIVSGKIPLTQLLSTVSTVAAVAKTAQTIANNPKALQAGLQSAAAGAAGALVGSAFSGGNPLNTILSGLGGLGGLQSIASGAQSLIGPLTGSFGAATAISGMMRGMAAGSVFSGLQGAPIPKIPNLSTLISSVSGLSGAQSVLGQVGALAGGLPIGQIGNLAQIGGLAQQVGQVSSAVQQAGQVGSVVRQADQLPLSLQNSMIQIPGSLPVSAVGNAIQSNPGTMFSVNNSINVTQRSVYPQAQGIPTIDSYNVNFVTRNVDSLQNSSITASLPGQVLNNSVTRLSKSNPGVNYNITRRSS